MIRRTFLAIAAATALSSPAFAQDMDIVETAEANGNFTTLLAAVDAAGLTDTLKGEGPYTVFAPTDDAFMALPEGTLDDLLKPENKEQLSSILMYHVVPGKVMSSDLSDGMEAETAGGDNVTVTVDASSVMVGEATVTTPDVEASNGVIHVIDMVLMPPM